MLDASTPSARSTPPPQPRGRGDRHRQDGRRRLRLPRLCDDLHGDRPSPALRRPPQEILDQSLRTYREVLRDADFGELLRRRSAPERWRHVFAASSRCTRRPREHPDRPLRRRRHRRVPPRRGADLRRLLDHLRPRELLGLTATPERADGVDVRELLRRPHRRRAAAVGRAGADLLCPFHYFGVTDDIDLPARVDRGGYDDSEPERLHRQRRAGRDRPRAAPRQGPRPRPMRALGFCVTVAHAELHGHGLPRRRHPALALSAGTTPRPSAPRPLHASRTARSTPLHRRPLQRGRGHPRGRHRPVPAADRERHVFLQQLGRGLRRTPGKAC